MLGHCQVLCGRRQEGVGTSFADAVSSYKKSTIALRRLRRELRGILLKLLKLLRKQRTPICKSWVNLLVRAAKELLRSTDCGQQYLVSK